MMNDKINKYTRKDATHALLCRHQICRNGWDYEMACLILGITKSGKYKILVFGDRYWGGNSKRIRYVPEYRLVRFPKLRENEKIN
jgi:hypothetical protein